MDFSDVPRDRDDVVCDPRSPQRGTRTPEPVRDEVPSTAPLGPLDPPSQLGGPRLDLGPLVPELERRWGAEPETGRFKCPIPGHTGFALLRPDLASPREEVRLSCCTGRTRPLGEVRAAQAYGHDVRCSNIQIATWLRRLAYELGQFEPLDVAVPELATDAPWYAKEARDGFRLLLGLRWADHPARAVAFSIRFAAVWCGVSERHARLGRAELLEQKVIVATDRIQRNELFMPGPLSEDELLERLKTELGAEEVFES